VSVFGHFLQGDIIIVGTTCGEMNQNAGFLEKILVNIKD
jgi:hypothetical protein